MVQPFQKCSYWKFIFGFHSVLPPVIGRFSEGDPPNKFFIYLTFILKF